MTIWALVVLLLASSQSQTQERKPVPKDSVEIAATGCLKGRVFTATTPREEVGVARGPDVTGRSFRLNGPREVMDEVKKHNGHLVEVVGRVRTSSLADNPPGKRIGNTRVVIGSPPPGNDPTAIHTAPPVGSVVVMDATSVRFVSEKCPIPRS